MGSCVLRDNLVSYVVQKVHSHFIDKEIESQRRPTKTSCGHLMPSAGSRVRSHGQPPPSQPSRAHASPKASQALPEQRKRFAP